MTRYSILELLEKASLQIGFAIEMVKAQLPRNSTSANLFDLEQTKREIDERLLEEELR